MKIITVFCFTIISTTIAVPSLPSNFKVCKRSDPNVSECLNNAVKEAIIFLSKGLESFKIMPLESLKITLNVNGTTAATTSLNQQYRNTVIYGLTKFELLDFQIDWNNSVMKFYTIHKQVDVLSDYKMEGRILVVPIYGDGKCKISAYDITINHELYFETFGKDGESYIRVKKYLLNFSNKRVVIHYDNLFNGNEILGTAINRFLNENSQLLFREFQPSVQNSVAKTFLEISNKIFTHVPVNKIFPLT